MTSIVSVKQKFPKITLVEICFFLLFPWQPIECAGLFSISKKSSISQFLIKISLHYWCHMKACETYFYIMKIYLNLVFSVFLNFRLNLEKYCFLTIFWCLNFDFLLIFPTIPNLMFNLHQTI